MASIKDVAALADVSTATASRALSGRGSVSREARERVLRASAELRFVPSANAAGLASGRSRNIGVVVPRVDRWFFAEVVGGISEVLLDRGYDLTLYTTGSCRRRQQKVLEDHLLRQRLDAIVVVELELTTHERHHLLSIGRPIVGVGDPMPGVCTVGIDQQAAAELAIGHLIALGHRWIAFITGGTDPHGHALVGSHGGGFQRAMAQAGLAVRPSWLIDSDFSSDSAYAQAKVLLSGEERPTAVLAASDEMAAGAMLAAQHLGLRVPDDVSVVGMDGHHIGEVIGLTTVRQFPERQGARAAALLMRQLASTGSLGEPHRETVTTELVIRSSTAVPRGVVDGLPARRPQTADQPRGCRPCLSDGRGRAGTR